MRQVEDITKVPVEKLQTRRGDRVIALHEGKYNRLVVIEDPSSGRLFAVTNVNRDGTGPYCHDLDIGVKTELKGRVLYKDTYTGKFDVTSDSYTQSEFTAGCLPTLQFIRIVTEIKELPVEEV